MFVLKTYALEKNKYILLKWQIARVINLAIHNSANIVVFKDSGLFLKFIKICFLYKAIVYFLTACLA